MTGGGTYSSTIGAKDFRHAAAHDFELIHFIPCVIESLQHHLFPYLRCLFVLLREKPIVNGVTGEQSVIEYYTCSEMAPISSVGLHSTLEAVSLPNVDNSNAAARHGVARRRRHGR